MLLAYWPPDIMMDPEPWPQWGYTGHSEAIKRVTLVFLGMGGNERDMGKDGRL